MKMYIVQEQNELMRMIPFDPLDDITDTRDFTAEMREKDEFRLEEDVLTTLFETGVVALEPLFFPFEYTPVATSFRDIILKDYLRKCSRFGVKDTDPIELRISFRKKWSSMQEYRDSHQPFEETVTDNESDEHCEAHVSVVGTPVKCFSFLNSFHSKLSVCAEVFYTKTKWDKVTNRRNREKQFAGSITIAEMPLSFPSDGVPVCEKVQVKLPKALCSQLRFDPCKNLVEFSAKVTIILDVVNYEFPKTLLQITGNCFQPTDFIIVSTDGKKFACHKQVLGDKSEKLGDIISQEGCDELVMKDMSSGVVDAFLKYLYISNVDTPDQDSTLAFDLLKAGHKYNIPMLEAHMSNILKEMLPNEFNLEVGKEMMTFSWNTFATSGGWIKAKASSILRAMSKKKGRKRKY